MTETAPQDELEIPSSLDRRDQMFAPLNEGEDVVTSPMATDDDWRVITPVPGDALRKLPEHRLGKPSTKWLYRDSEGKPLFFVCRFDTPDGKEVLPLTYGEDAQGKRWRWKGFPAPRPLYGLDRLAARPDAPVIIVEGEKPANAAQGLFPDYVATTSLGGSKAAHKADWRGLKGRQVVIWPDNDKPGRAYAEDVSRLSQEAGAASVGIISVPKEFPASWDVADTLPDGWDIERLHGLMDVAVVKLDEAAPNKTEREELEAELDELAILDPAGYMLRRKGVSEKHSVPVGMIDSEVEKRRKGNEEDTRTPFIADIEPWPESIEGEALLDEITDAILRFVVMPRHAAEATALWVVHTHCHDAAMVSPIIAIESPERGCGKTTLLSVLQSLVPRALPTSNITAAALFRAVERWEPTLLIDEGDSFIRGNDDLRGILNSGHSRTSAYVIRTTGDDYEPERFRTWAPKAIALIGTLPDTLQDRSIVIELQRKTAEEHVQRFRLDRTKVIESIARKTARWAEDNIEELLTSDPKVPQGLFNRVADNWRPLIAIADLAGGEWPQRARNTALSCLDGGSVTSPGVTLLEDIHGIFKETEEDRITSHDLVGRLVAMEDRPWPEWRRGAAITAAGVARLLKPFSLTPATIRTAMDKTAKGYLKDSFSNAFSRYLHPQTVTSSQMAENCAKQALSNRNMEKGCYALEHTSNPQKTAECYGVTAREESIGVEMPDEDEERAAIMEYDGGLSRREAEEAAQEENDDRA